MRKTTLLLLMLLAAPLCAFAADAAPSDADSISEIEEKAGFEKGAYTAPADAQSATLNVKKGEGFDFKVPEILITGQVDTKVMLKREIISLEDIQSVRNILYEKERVYMPDYYLKEEALSPQALDAAIDRDFVGKLSLLAGSYSWLSADGVIGRAFDRFNKAVLRVSHDNYANERTNDRDTYDNLNTADLYYSTKYDLIEAVYRVSCRLDRYGNPYPSDIFLNTLSADEALLSASMTGTVAGVKGTASAGYLYFGGLNSASDYIFKENRFFASVTAERDFKADIGSKIKVIASLDGRGGPQFIDGSERASAFVNLFAKGIIYLEPVVLQFGVKFQDYYLGSNYFSTSPYLDVNYDPLPFLSLYASFKPEMRPADYTQLMPGRFLRPSSSLLPSTESVNLRAGLNLNIFDVFVDAYYGHFSISDNIYMDEDASTRAFTLYNNDIEYNTAGFSAEALRSGSLTVTLSYEYRNLISSSTAGTTYLPNNEFDLKLAYTLREWTFKASCGLVSGFNGTLSQKAPAYALVDLGVSWKLNDYFTLEGRVNNVLNNNYYLLYYYKEKLLNLGLGITAVF